MKFFNQALLSLLLLLPVSAWAGTVVRVNSQLGEFFIELSDDTTPITANNFLSYVNEGLYNGTVIHRLVPGFVIQGGWLKYDQSIRTFAPIATKGNIQNEFRVSNQRGTLAMAKVGGDCSGLMEPDTLISDNICQLLRCHYGSNTYAQNISRSV